MPRIAPKIYATSEHQIFDLDYGGMKSWLPSRYAASHSTISPSMTLLMPFTEESQLNRDSTTSQPSCSPTLPGHPRIPLQDAAQLRDFLYRELWAVDLERMAPHLWIMSTQSSSNVSPLHQQKVKARKIIVTEDPRLHLVWIYDRVFIKPLPRYLLSYTFWSEHMSNEKSTLWGSNEEEQKTCTMIRMSALGFLRTYYYLIQHESDFEIARNETRLLPSDITWTEFCAFSKDFLDISDDDVSERYHYGELRLTRLNLYAKLITRKFQYEHVHGQYGAFFARFYGPLLFIFGILSIILSAMQVELGVETLTNARWQSFWYACRWFVIVALASMVLLVLALISLLVGMIVDEWVFALRKRYERGGFRRRQQSNA